MANLVDPDQTLHSAASDLGLHCLPSLSVQRLCINTAEQKSKLFFFFFFVLVNQTAFHHDRRPKFCTGRPLFEYDHTRNKYMLLCQ